MSLHSKLGKLNVFQPALIMHYTIGINTSLLFLYSFHNTRLVFFKLLQQPFCLDLYFFLFIVTSWCQGIKYIFNAYFWMRGSECPLPSHQPLGFFCLHLSLAVFITSDPEVHVWCLAWFIYTDVNVHVLL